MPYRAARPPLAQPDHVLERPVRGPMDNLLKHQLSQLGLTAYRPPGDLAGWRAFLEQVGRAYGEHRQESGLLEAALTASAEEMRELYDDLRREIQGAEIRARVALLLLGGQTLEERLQAALTAIEAAVELKLDHRALIAFASSEGERKVRFSRGDLPKGLLSVLARTRSANLTPIYRPGQVPGEPGGILVPISHGGAIRGLVWLGTAGIPELDSAQQDLLRLVAGMIGIAVADDRTRREAERARLAALAAVRAKARFLANMSHEIRTPMNGVLGMLEMLGQTAMTPEQQDYVDTAQGSADSLLTIIDDILDYSKIEAGKLDLEHIPFDARFIAEDVATLFTARAQSQSLELACFVPVDIHTRVVGDPTRLRQVLSNILSNAIKFTRCGEVVLRICEQPPPQGQDKPAGNDRVGLRFEVQDTGIGLTQEQIAQLFQPFVQADDSTTRRFGGTGLGLAICKQLVELMGGEIGADSEPGRGSLFWFFIPFERQTEQTHTPDWEGLSTTRVLAVDDNATNLTILAHYLKSWGLEYDTTRDGFEALERLRAAAAALRPFDIALVDMQMPGMDGLDLGRAIKSDPMIANTRLLLLSSIGQGDQNLREAGFLFGLNKPIRQSILYDTLLRVHDTQAEIAPSEPKGSMVPDNSAEGRRVRSPTRERLKGRVLLAEDNLINQRVALGMLGRLGVEVAVANNGAQALELALAEPFDLVLMDCEMPVMDGFAATRSLRTRMPSGAGRRLPIVALTANAMAGDREKCLAAGMDDYLSKPIRLDQLVDTLGRWLERADQGSEQFELPPATTANEPVPPPPPAASAPRKTRAPGSAIDREGLHILRETMGERLARTLDRFENRSSELVEALAEAIARNDPEDLAQAAHELKGSAGHVGASALCELAGRMEDLGRSWQLDQAKSELDALRIEHVRSLAAVVRLRVEMLARAADLNGAATR